MVYTSLRADPYDLYDLYDLCDLYDLYHCVPMCTESLSMSIQCKRVSYLGAEWYELYDLLIAHAGGSRIV